MRCLLWGFPSRPPWCTSAGVSDVTRVIEAAQRGDPKAAEELLPLVYEELRKLAASKMANEAAGNTLQPTALVHEAWLRLVGNDNPKFAGRAHFFAAAAEAEAGWGAGAVMATRAVSPALSASTAIARAGAFVAAPDGLAPVRGSVLRLF